MTQHRWHQAVIPQVAAAIREEVGDALTEDQLRRAAVAAMSASLTGIIAASQNGQIPQLPEDQ